MTARVSHALSAYRMAASQVHPLVAVVRLFEDAARRVGAAADLLEARRFEEAYVHITRVSLILRGLARNLRDDLSGAEGKELAGLLKHTYVTNLMALHTAYGKKDAPARYRRIRAGLWELRNAWAVVAGMPETAL